VARDGTGRGACGGGRVACGDAGRGACGGGRAGCRRGRRARRTCVAGATASTLKIDTVRLEYTASVNPADGGEMTVRPWALVIGLALTVLYLAHRFLSRRPSRRQSKNLAATLDQAPAQ
ncbi:hypothetical protein, partial [Actinoplanes philippinensis]|uniref:hypothetical protein n=1 Tax=Actinoplanes philippinensis TaxID=35752 RepID=UPI0033D51688